MTKEEYKAEQLKNALRKAITALELAKENVKEKWMQNEFEWLTEELGNVIDNYNEE